MRSRLVGTPRHVPNRMGSKKFADVRSAGVEQADRPCADHTERATAQVVESRPLWSEADLRTWGHLVVPLVAKQARRPEKDSWLPGATGAIAALLCAWPLRNKEQFLKAARLWVPGSPLDWRTLGPVGLAYGQVDDDQAVVHKAVIPDARNFWLLRLDDGRYLPFSRFSAQPSAEVPQASVQDEPKLGVGPTEVRATVRFEEPIDSGKPVEVQSDLDRWISVSEQGNRRLNQGHHSFMNAESADAFFAHHSVNRSGSFVGVPWVSEPVVLDLESVPLLDHLSVSDEDGWELDGETFLVVRPEERLDVPLLQAIDGWAIVLADKSPFPSVWDQEWEDISKEFDNDEEPIVIDSDDFVAVHVGATGESECIQAIECPHDVPETNGLVVDLARGKEAPPCTEVSADACWLHGETEEAPAVPMLEAQESNFYATFRRWLRGWRGELVEMRVEILRKVPLRHGQCVYFRKRGENIGPGPEAAGGAIPLDRVKHIIAEDAVFDITDRREMELLDGRRYQVGFLSLVKSDRWTNGVSHALKSIVLERLRLRSHVFSRVALFPSEDLELTLDVLSDLPTAAAQVRAAYNLLIPLVDDVNQGIIRDIRSEHLPLANLKDFEPVKIVRQVQKGRRYVENMAGRKAAFSLK